MKKSHVNSVLKTISEKSIRVKSRMRLLAERLGAGGLFALLMGMLLVLSGSFFVWYAMNSDLLVQYGVSGVAAFFGLFPLYPFLAFLCAMLCSILVIRMFDISYKVPLVFLLLGACLLAIGAAFITAQLPTGKNAYTQAGRMMGIMGTTRMGAHFITGVFRQDQNLPAIEISGGKRIELQISENTHLPYGMPSDGDFIRVVGAWNGDTFTVQGIRLIGDTQTGGKGGDMMRRGGMMRGTFRE